MAIELFSEAPSVSDFQPLEEYQSSTPAAFFDGKPVLHYHNPSCTLTISNSALSTTAFSNLQGGAVTTTTTTTTSPAAPQQTNGTTNGDHAAADSSSSTSTWSGDETKLEQVQAWITSRHFTLFSPGAGKGLHVPYPVISLHALQGAGLYMQLMLSDARHTSDEDLETVELVLTPSVRAEGVEEGPEGARLFAAVSDCADLHPDPNQDEEGEESAAGLMAMLRSAGGGGGDGSQLDLGAGGWITTENMHEHVDGEGNLVFPRGATGGEEGLGPGAGTRRAAEDEVDGEALDGNGEGSGDGEAAKWRRTDD